MMQQQRTKGEIRIPEPQQENTHKDEVVLEYIDNIRSQFVQLYPDRPINLFFHPINEHGSERFATTYIRSTKLPYKELYEYKEAARFIADHLQATYKAHCFEYATLLVSILLGVGYDAYCVYGYASKAVTLNDQTQRDPPFDVLNKNKGDDNSQQGSEPTTYESLIAKKPHLQSQYLKNKEDKKKMEEAMQKTALEGATQEADKKGAVEEKDNKDPFEGRRIHCWVLLLPGKRDIEEFTFIEPTTGLVVPTKSKEYIGIESVWNDSNYWVNMQSYLTHQAVRPNTFSSLLWDLGNSHKWEAVFMDPDAPTIGRPPSRYSVKVAGDKTGKKNETELEVLRCPTSWVKRIEISKHEYLTRFPNGEISKDYKLCTVERFAPYHRTDGVVMYITMYKADDRKEVVENREFFENRKDFLEQRVSLLNEKTVCEMFGRGRAHGLKEYIKTPDRIELVFHSSIRIDGLAKRIEFIGKKTAEYYEGREDFLIYRSVTFSTDKTMEVIRLSETEISLPMRKITEKFNRNPAVPADEDVQKISFAMDQKKIILHYHIAAGRITAASRLYSKEGKAKDYQVDPFAPKPTARQLAADFQRIAAVERECIQKLRDTYQEANEIVKSRETEEANIELTASIYDTWRGGKKKEGAAAAEEEKEKEKWKEEEEAEKEEEEEEPKVRDPLAAFLTSAAGKPMTRELALQIKEAALRSLKERLIQKANLIHSRLEKETNSLLRLQANHQRGKDNQEVAVEDDVEYERQTHEAMFRIRVLEERLTRHEKMSIEKFQALDHKIVTDARIADFL